MFTREDWQAMTLGWSIAIPIAALCLYVGPQWWMVIIVLVAGVGATTSQLMNK